MKLLEYTCWDRFRRNHLLLVVTIPVTLVFLMAGSMKVTGSPMMLFIFENRYGFPAWFMFFIGYAEVFGAISLWLKRWAFPGSIGLLVIAIAASAIHVALGDGPDIAGMAWGVTLGTIIIVLYHWRAEVSENRQAPSATET